jgi:hypothetical protein
VEDIAYALIDKALGKCATFYNNLAVAGHAVSDLHPKKPE